MNKIPRLLEARPVHAGKSAPVTEISGHLNTGRRHKSDMSFTLTVYKVSQKETTYGFILTQ